MNVLRLDVRRKEQSMKRILMYYDGSEYAKDVLGKVKKHVKAFSASVDVVSSLSRGGESNHKRLTEIKNDLLFLKTALERDKIPCETHIFMRGNYAGHDVINFAQERGVDEIIIGAEKNTRVDKLILGSVAQFLILNADCPVVIV
ncbi:MAG TPA: universal stress protein [Deltaproteobacteria bacterium]|nr:universal stress protein [Deltaproteobacteria bacterium]HOI08624.1 universal stress protein [Deltaproteobacteria bacterium]